MSALLHYGHKLLNRAYRLKATSFMVFLITCLLSISTQAQTNINSTSIDLEVPLDATSTTDFVFTTANFTVQNDIESASMFEVVVTGREGAGALEISLNGGDAQQFDITGDGCGMMGVAGPQTFDFGDMNCYSTENDMITINVQRAGTDCGDNMVSVQLRWIDAFTADPPAFSADFPAVLELDAGIACDMTGDDVLAQIIDSILVGQYASDNVVALGNLTTPGPLVDMISITNQAMSYASTCTTGPHTIELVVTDGCDALSVNDTLSVMIEITEDDAPVGSISGVGAANPADRLLIPLGSDCTLDFETILDSIMSGTNLAFDDGTGCGFSDDNIVIDSLFSSNANLVIDNVAGTIAIADGSNACGAYSFRAELDVIDACGNTSAHTRVRLELDDLISPALTVPGMITFYSSSASGLASIDPSECRITINEFQDSLLLHPDFSVSDNCSDAGAITVVGIGDDFPLETTCSTDMISYPVRVEATDDCGNLSYDTVMVQVLDDTDPVLSFSSTELEITIDVPDFTCLADSTLIADEIITQLSALATDNCSTVSVGVIESAGLMVTSCDDPHPAQTVTFFAEDACGNQTTETISVILNEPIPLPQITIGGEDARGGTQGDPGAGTIPVAGSDNTRGNGTNPEVILDVPLNASCGITLAEISASVLSQVDTLIDGCTSYTALLDGSEVNILENVDLPVQNDIDLGDAVCGDYFDIEFSTTDECGNASTMHLSIQIIDDTDPVISGPTSFTLYASSTDCGPLNEETLIDSLLSAGLTVTDATCGVVTYELFMDNPETGVIEYGTVADLRYDQLPGDGDPPIQLLIASCDPQNVTMYVRVQEDCGTSMSGFSDVVEITVSYIDTLAPEFDIRTTGANPLTNDTIIRVVHTACDSNFNVFVFDNSSITDCNTFEITYSTGDPTGGNPSNVNADWSVGVTDVTGTITDACGNEATHDFVVIVEDGAAPNLNLDVSPLSLDVLIDETCSIDSLTLLDSILVAINNGEIDITATDNCVLADTIIVSGLASYEVTAGCSNDFGVEIAVTDTSGNVSQTITIPISLIDNIAPTVTASAGSTPATAISFDACGINLDDFGVPADITDVLSVSDNCTEGTLTFSEILAGATTQAFGNGNLKNVDGSPFEIDLTAGDNGLCEALTIATGRDRRKPIVWKDLTRAVSDGINWPEGTIFATVEFAAIDVVGITKSSDSQKKVGKIEGRQVFEMGDGQNDELEELLVTMCMFDQRPPQDIEDIRLNGNGFNKAIDYDINACDVDGPQPVYYVAMDNCGNSTVDSIYVDVFENSKPNLFVYENYIHSFTIPASTMSCSPDSAALVSSIRTNSSSNVQFSAACSNESASLSIDAASLAGLEVDCSTEQQITIRVTGQCNDQDTSATLRIRILEEAPAPIVTIAGRQVANGQSNGVKGNRDVLPGMPPVASMGSDLTGETNPLVQIPLDATTCMIDEASIATVVNSLTSIRDNCTDLATLTPTVDVRVLNNIDLPDDNDIVLSELACGDEFDIEYTVRDECGNVTAIHFTAIVVNNETPEVLLPGGAQTFDFTLYSSGNDDCTALNTDELEERLIEAGLDTSGICGDAIFEFALDNPETGGIEYGNVAGRLYENLVAGDDGIMADPDFDPLTPECMSDPMNTITLFVRVREECGGSIATYSPVKQITVTLVDTTAADFTLYGGNVVNDTLSVTTSDYNTVPDGCDFDVDKQIVDMITDCNAMESVVTYTDLTDAANVLETGEMNDYLIGTFPVGFSDVEVSVADACGNIALDTIVIEVIDGVDPTITITAEGSSSMERLGVQIGADCSIDSLSLLDSILTLTDIVFSDSCGIAETIILSEASYELSDGSDMCNPNVMVTIQTTDVNGLTETEDVYITLEDSIAPVLSVPGELTFLTSVFGSDLTQIEFRDSLLQNPLFDVSDNCTDSTTIVNYTMDLTVVVDGVDLGFGDIASTCDSIFKIAVDVRDYCGDNLTTDTVLVTLQDDVQPDLTIHNDIAPYINDTLPLLFNGMGLCTVDDTGEAEEAPLRINVLMSPHITDDNETTVTATAVFEDGEDVDFDILFSNMSAVSAAWPVGVTRIDYSVTDECGNDSTLVFFVEVADNEDPAFMDVPMDMTFDNEPGLCDSTVTFNCPRVMDNCGVDSLQVWYIFDDGSAEGETIFVEVFTGEDAMGGEEAIFPFEVGTTEVRFRAVDIHGNDREDSFTVTIEDIELPVFDCPSSINLYLDEDGMAVLDSSALLANGASDNCGLVTMGIVNVAGGTPDNTFTCANIGDAIAYTITAEDESGNMAASCLVIVNIMDTIIPTISLNGDDFITLSCGESYVENATVTDNCDAAPILSIDGSVNTNVAGTYVLNYNGTDASGNEAMQVSRTVVVESGLPSGPVLISGETDIVGGTVATYTFPSFDGIDDATINWSYTGAGAIFQSGQGSNTVTIEFTSGFTPGDLIVSVSNLCDEITGILLISQGCLDELTVVAIDNVIDEYFANEAVVSSALVDQAREILFQAADSILLSPNFEVELGAVFEANIGPCLTPTVLTQLLDENNGVEKE